LKQYPGHDITYSAAKLRPWNPRQRGHVFYASADI